MDTALHRAEFPAVCAVAATGALAGRTDPEVAMVVDPAPADSSITEQVTPRLDTVEEAV